MPYVLMQDALMLISICLSACQREQPRLRADTPCCRAADITPLILRAMFRHYATFHFFFSPFFFWFCRY